jgi:hypothetical protein
LPLDSPIASILLLCMHHACINRVSERSAALFIGSQPRKSRFAKKNLRVRSAVSAGRPPSEEFDHPGGHTFTWGLLAGRLRAAAETARAAIAANKRLMHRSKRPSYSITNQRHRPFLCILVRDGLPAKRLGGSPMRRRPCPSGPPPNPRDWHGEIVRKSGEADRTLTT